MGVGLAEVRSAAEAIAREAGGLLVAGAARMRDDVTMRAEVTSKASAMDVVTTVDVAAEALMVRRIAELFPGDGVIGEEGAARASETGRRWIIDPVDGTSNFVRGWNMSVVSIGVEVDGKFAVGAVFDPFRDEMFSAATGLGATLNGRPLPRRTGVPPLAESFVGVIGGYPDWARKERVKVIAELLVRAGEVRATGTTALEMCYVAAGRLDAAFANGHKIWDMAAGAVLAAETGCVVAETVVNPAAEGEKDRQDSDNPNHAQAFQTSLIRIMHESG